MAHLRLVGEHERMDAHIDVADLLPAYTTWLLSWGAAASTVTVRTSVLSRALVAAGSDPAELPAWLARHGIAAEIRITGADIALISQIRAIHGSAWLADSSQTS